MVASVPDRTEYMELWCVCVCTDRGCVWTGVSGGAG